MSWITDKAINRIYNTFKRIPKQIFKEDIEALKSLNEYVENSDSKIIADNLLYAKLLCINLRQSFDYFGNINTAIKQTSSDLKIPLEAHIQWLQKKMNDRQYQDFLLSLNIKTDFETLEDIENNKINISKHQKEIAESLKSAWQFKEVEKSFYNTANQFLKDVNNYK